MGEVAHTMAIKISRYHPLNTFLWVCTKERVHRTPVCDIITLQSRIIRVLATVNEEILENTWRKIEYRLDIQSNNSTKGAYVEVHENLAKLNS